MIYGSVCSGIEAATAAWKPLGWEPAFFSEIEKFPCAVLKHHYPEIQLLSDFTSIRGHWLRRLHVPTIDILVGGTPCQSFSLAGLRGGMDDDRGNLALEYLRLAKRLRPRWLVWENVPGVLSSGRGRDFGSFLGALGELGYGFSYRVLDAQYFGLAQRRKRVFVVGYLGDWRRAAAVLFEPDSLRGNPAPSREAREVSPTIPSRSTASGGLGSDFDCDGGLRVAHTLRANHDGSEDGTGRGVPILPVCLSSKDHGADATTDLTPTLRQANAVAIHENQRGEITTNQVAGALAGGGGKPGQGYPAVAVALRGRDAGSQIEIGSDVSNTLRTPTGGSSTGMVFERMAVRRLTPRECERLQGFPDDFTKIPWRKKSREQCPDGPRYKALGNSMAVPVMAWIGVRIQMVEEIRV